MSRLRLHHGGDDADEWLPVFLRLPALCRAVETTSRTLLRVLQLRVDQVRPGAAGRRMLPVI